MNSTTREKKLKLNYNDRLYLENLITETIESIEFSLSQNDINNISDVKKRINEGDYQLEELIGKLNAFKNIREKLKVVSEEGASVKQIVSLSKTAQKRKNKTKEKILNAINMLHLENRKITVNSVSKIANISFNTAKQYRDAIEEREKLRVST